MAGEDTGNITGLMRLIQGKCGGKSRQDIGGKTQSNQKSKNTTRQKHVTVHDTESMTDRLNKLST